MSAEYTLRKRTGLKQGEAQKDGVAHNTPDRTDDVITECDRLNQHRINAYADHNQESLESDCKQRTQIILSDIACISRICRKRGVKKMTWWITDTSIGQRLKFIRRFRRLTQKELGLLMGYSEKTADVRIAQYEKNARTPNAETTAKLAEVLKVSPVVFSPTICASREDLLQSMYWLFLMKGGGDIYDCETEYARSRMEQKLGVITVEEFLEKILVN